MQAFRDTKEGVPVVLHCVCCGTEHFRTTTYSTDLGHSLQECNMRRLELSDLWVLEFLSPGEYATWEGLDSFARMLYNCKEFDGKRCVRSPPPVY